MKIVLSILFVCLVYLATAQVSIHGYVQDKTTKEPLIGATISISWTTQGTTTNNSGYFTLRVPESVTTSLTIRYIGYKTQYIEVSGHNTSPGYYFLEPGVEIEEVTVNAPVFSEKQFGVNMTEIPVQELKKLPALGGEVDLLRTYQLLPGVQGGSEGKSGLYVRGGGPGQNLVLLDGSPLYYVNHLGGFSSIFDPESVNNFKLYKGGFPAHYGGRLSSVLDVQMKEGDKSKHQTFASIGTISGRFNMQGPLQQGKGSYFVSVRRMWLDLLMRPFTLAVTEKASTGYSFYDINSKVSLQLSQKDKLFLSLYSGDDKLVLSYNEKFIGPDQKAKQKVKWGNLLAVARLNHTFKPGLSNNTKVSFTKYRFIDNDLYQDKSDNIELNSEFKSRIYDWAINSDFEFQPGNKYKMLGGAGATFHFFMPGKTSATHTEAVETYIDSTYGSTSLRAFESQAYIENIFSFKHLNVNLGARLCHFLVEGKNYLYAEPRVSLGVPLFSATSATASYTQMHQFVNMLSNPTAGFETDFWVPATRKVPPSDSKQFALGIERNTQDFEAGIEAYYKKLNNLVTFKEGEVFQGNATDWQERVALNGTGTSKGLEFFLRKKTGKFTGWVSYTLAKSDRQFDDINFGETYPYKYDRRHDLSLVISVPINEEWNFSSTWVYGSGYPITLALGKMNTIEMNDIPNGSNNYYQFDEYGEYYGKKNSFKMQDYHRLDIGLTRTRESYGVERTLTIGIYNVYNRKNPYYYFYKQRKPWRGDYTTELYKSSFLPFLPAISYSWRF
ncbi:TonB-dependent receptor [Maribellus mangrovi]|uniref:TonB-dependent receptor n=1 Tax=Maribellus mangrovi TaxID=3133146 RepID=UPI0030ECFA82